MTKKEPTALEILACIQQASVRQVDPDPAWKTVVEWAGAWNLSEAYARKVLMDAVKAGQMKVDRRYKSVGQTVRLVQAYRFIGKAK